MRGPPSLGQKKVDVSKAGTWDMGASRTESKSIRNAILTHGQLNLFEPSASTFS